MTGPETLSRADQLSNMRYTLDKMRTKLAYKIRAFTEDDVDKEDLEEARLKLQEIDDLFCSTWCHIDSVTQSFKAELEPQGVKELQDLVGPMKAQVRDHAKKIRSKIKALSPPARALSSYELESLELQKQMM